MLVNKNINNLFGGVSQQPEPNRFDNQVESMDNFLVTVAQGLRKRNPLETVNTVSTGDFSNNMAIHAYDRGDGQEKYGMIFDDNGLRIFDTAGVEKTVNTVGTINPLTQWTTGSDEWNKKLKFLTVGDTTWLLNTKQVVSHTSPNDNVNENKAFYWIKKTTTVTYGSDNGSFKGYNYEIVLNGTAYNAYTILGSDTTDSINVASRLAAAINGDTNGGVTFTATSKGSIVYITGNGAFTFESGDSFGNQASAGWRDSVAKLTDLPADMNGFTDSEIGTIAITGTDRDEFNNYYLMWDEDHWKETYRPDTKIIWDVETMPAKVVRQADGTFDFGFNEVISGSDGFYETWAERDKGDEESNPIPSFNGFTISNMFFFKNRLGFTSDENVILSETGSYYNFFATTVMDLLDSDPIDAAVDSNTVSVIRNVNVTGNAVTLWADNAQFLLSGGEVLSPATTRISQTSSYVCDNGLAPIAIDNEVLFFNKLGNFLQVSTYAPASLQADKTDAESLTSHVPEYLPDTITEIKVSPAHNLVFLRDSADQHTLYVYKYYIKGKERVISAWFKWTFSDIIRSIEVLSGTLFVLANENEILKMELEPLDITGVFLDKGTIPYTANVLMSAFNAQTRENTKIIREPFYIKNIKVVSEGEVDFYIQNSERLTAGNPQIKTINNKHINRKLFVGGNSEKINTGFSSSYDTGCEIDVINIEGRVKTKSRNI